MTVSFIFQGALNVGPNAVTLTALFAWVALQRPLRRLSLAHLLLYRHDKLGRCLAGAPMQGIARLPPRDRTPETQKP